jgi:hypothetical protein
LPTPCANDDAFTTSRERFEEVVSFLGGDQAKDLTHAQLEDQLASRGRELLRQLYQDHLDLRSEHEARLASVTDAAGVARGSVETGHGRTLTTIFGTVSFTRMAYRRRGQANLHLADADLNLPRERHSHGLRRLVATEASRGSFDEATAVVRATTGTAFGKRQAEELARLAAVDFDAFYQSSARPVAGPDDVLVLSADGKGIVMLADALRAATARAAAKTNPKLATRLSKGEKRNRKRLAEVGAVYHITPVPRTAGDVLANHEHEHVPGPRACAKWLTASVVHDTSEVISTIFDEAERRDPAHARTWVGLVDGNNHQIDRIHAEAEQRGVTVHVLVDFVHVLEYLWRAAWSFHSEGDPDAETWVHDKAMAVLNGQASIVAAAIRRKATRRRLTPAQRLNADRCAGYLLNKRDYLDYPTALTNGWPIATGIIEGACRHLVKDRMDITGARWGLEGAEAVLQLRALRTNGDFDNYWDWHLTQERHRIHETRYANNEIPHAA